MNNVVLTGRLVADPELNYTTTQTAICKFTLAVERPRKTTEDKTADFIDIVVFSSQAENASRYLEKGKKCGVVGRIQTGSYKNREGKTVKTFDVIASNVEFLDRRERPSDREIPKEPAYENFSAINDRIPF